MVSSVALIKSDCCSPLSIDFNTGASPLNGLYISIYAAYSRGNQDDWRIAAVQFSNLSGFLTPSEEVTALTKFFKGDSPPSIMPARLQLPEFASILERIAKVGESVFELCHTDTV